MTLDSANLSICGRIARDRDRARFLATLFAPAGGTREALLTLCAFQATVAALPDTASEPAMAQMRLRWWLDAIDSALAGAPPPRHEVAGPLAHLMQARGLPRAPLRAIVLAQSLRAAGALHPMAAAAVGGGAGAILAATVLAPEAMAAPSTQRATRRAIRAAGAALSLTEWIRAEVIGLNSNSGDIARAIAAARRRIALARAGSRHLPRHTRGRLAPALLCATLAAMELPRLGRAKPPGQPSPLRAPRMAWAAWTGRF